MAGRQMKSLGLMTAAIAAAYRLANDQATPKTRDSTDFTGVTDRKPELNITTRSRNPVS